MQLNKVSEEIIHFILLRIQFQSLGVFFFQSRFGFDRAMAFIVAMGIIIVGIAAIFIRVVYVVHRTGKPLKPRGKASRPFSTLIVLGSGGHTAEMLNVLQVLQKDRFSPRVYIAAATDNMSLQKARLLESSLAKEVFEFFFFFFFFFWWVGVYILAGEKVVKASQFLQIYRSREVGQSYLTSVWTTLVAIAHALWIMIRIRPEVILCNGPGTCIPLCIIAFLFKVVGIRWSFVFYVESIARVQRLSLSGFILYKLHIADQFFVQWPQLQRKYPRAHYVGCLM
ncbi:hypothetical protein FEM48_Zijuj08G0159300 [Ziziphus jujuba var. spinosa]|uniref:UDP-N-acetylglucosamine transferase subunit ALG14 n=1 Tax=Ziziphus jujuba var. spinosa TaxID=714518 RepID=A0A978V008_ZIZJJ|nr:hypothetical protein FEM48_Zijuj08G0159300 [Ziziphus jujuba var. spinosa]